MIGVAAAYGMALEPRGPRALDALRLPGRPPDRGEPRPCGRSRGARSRGARIAGCRAGRGPGDPRRGGGRQRRSRRHGAELLADARRILTHCNTGALAAPGRGTALAVIAELAGRGRLEKVIATESRPLLQGARLTVYELGRLGIPHELVVDSAARRADRRRRGRRGDRRLRPGGRQRRRGQQGRHLRAGAGRRGPPGSRSWWPGRRPTIDYATPTGAGHSDRGARADEVRAAAGRPPNAGRARPAATRPSTSPRRHWSPRWSPSAASPPGPAM